MSDANKPVQIRLSPVGHRALRLGATMKGMTSGEFVEHMLQRVGDGDLYAKAMEGDD